MNPNDDQPPTPSPEGEEGEARDPVEALAEEFIERRRRGERPSISEYTNRSPELASRISILFPTLIDIEEAGLPHEPPAAADLEAPRDPASRPLGDYQVLREVARGGMGIVYEAEQISLGRRVALKVLHSSRMGDERLAERFRREARSAACLHHSNIVPVYGTGEVDGALFYAMQFIDGRNLAEVLEEVRRQRQSTRHEPTPAELAEESDGSESHREPPAPNRPGLLSDSAASLTGSSSVSIDGGRSRYVQRVAGIARQVADALAYAHGEGVLHRDIKPSNLLLDVKGNVWVTDFGLAKAEGATELTHTGDVVGTIAYLAPERLDGWSDPRSDVYSLGITLYELLTLRRAFPQSTRPEVLQAIARKDPLSPRKVDASIPRDLETIVLKAIDKNPAYRYSSAREMADDLGRFLELRPIFAKRTGTIHRSWRWCQRSPLAASLAATSLILLAALAAGGTIAALRLREERNAARNAEAIADERLLDARIASARWRREAGAPGQRFESLRELRGVAASRKDSAVATEAVACLGRFDLELDQERTTESWAVAMDPTLATYAVGLRDGSVNIRRMADDELVRRIPPSSWRSGGVNAMRFSSSGKLLAIGCDPADGYHIRVVDAADGRELLRTAAPGNALALDFEPGEKRVALRGEEGSLQILPLVDGATAPVRLTAPGGPSANALAFDPAGKRIASLQPESSSPCVLIWDVAHARLEKALVHGEPPYQLAWHPEGKLLAVACRDYLAYLWDVDSERIVRKHAGHRAEVVAVSFSPNGATFGTSSWDSESRFWDVATGLPLSHAFGNLCGWGRDGRSAWFIRGVNKLGTWRIAPGDEIRRLRFHLTGKGPRRIAMPPEGDLIVAACELDGLQVALADGGGPWILSKGRVLDAAFLADGRGLLAGGDKLLLYPVQRTGGLVRFGEPRAILERGGEIALSADNRFVACVNERNEISLVDLEGQKAHRPVKKPHARVSRLAASRGGRWVAASTIHPLETFLIEGGSGEEVHRFSWGGGALAFSPDDRCFVESAADAIYAVEAGTWRVLWSHPRRESGSYGGSVVFSTDGRFVFAAPSRTQLGLYEVSSGREVVGFSLIDDGLLSAACVGGSLLAVGSAVDYAQLWDLAAVDRQLHALGLELGLDLPPPAAGPPANAIEVPSRAGPILVTSHPPSSWQEKLEGLTLLLQADRKNAEHYQRRAEAFMENGLRQEALADLQAALAQKPKRPALLHHRRAQILEGMGQLEASLEELDRGVEIEPSFADALQLRASVLDRLARETEAVRDLERALAASPGHPLAAETLAWILLSGPQETRDPKRALDLARQAAAKRPDLVYQQRTLGLACYRAGLFDEARAAAERAIALPNGDTSPSSWLILSLARAKAGDLNGAGQAFWKGARRLSDPARRRILGAAYLRRLEELFVEAQAAIEPANLPETK